MTTPIFTNLAGNWDVPNHFTPLPSSGKVTTGDYIIFWITCDKCHASYRNDFKTHRQFECTVEGLKAWASEHRHA